MEYANFEEMRRLNAVESNPAICHSHDFCDANMSMLEAFQYVMDRTARLSDQADIDMINAAWEHAKAEYLTANTA